MQIPHVCREFFRDRVPSEPEGNSRTLQVQVEAGAPAADSSASVDAAESAPVTDPGFEAGAVAALRCQGVLDAFDPGPRPDAAVPRARGFLYRTKRFYAQELIHDTAADTENAERTPRLELGQPTWRR